MEKKMEKLKIVGTKNKVAFLWDLIASGDHAKWHYDAGNIQIHFSGTNTRKAQKAIYEMLRERKELGVF